MKHGNTLSESAATLAAALRTGDEDAAVATFGDFLKAAKAAGSEAAHAPKKGTAAHAGDDESAALDDLAAACRECQTAPPKAAAAAPVGKIGDGKFLELIVKYLPMILALFGK